MTHWVRGSGGWGSGFLVDIIDAVVLLPTCSSPRPACAWPGKCSISVASSGFLRAGPLQAQSFLAWFLIGRRGVKHFWQEVEPQRVQRISPPLSAAVGTICSHTWKACSSNVGHSDVHAFLRWGRSHALVWWWEWSEDSVLHRSYEILIKEGRWCWHRVWSGNVVGIFNSVIKSSEVMNVFALLFLFSMQELCKQ